MHKIDIDTRPKKGANDSVFSDVEVHSDDNIGYSTEGSCHNTGVKFI